MKPLRRSFVVRINALEHRLKSYLGQNQVALSTNVRNQYAFCLLNAAAKHPCPQTRLQRTQSDQCTHFSRTSSAIQVTWPVRPQVQRQVFKASLFIAWFGVSSLQYLWTVVPAVRVGHRNSDRRNVPLFVVVLHMRQLSSSSHELSRRLRTNNLRDASTAVVCRREAYHAFGIATLLRRNVAGWQKSAVCEAERTNLQLRPYYDDFSSSRTGFTVCVPVRVFPALHRRL